MPGSPHILRERGAVEEGSGASFHISSSEIDARSLIAVHIRTCRHNDFPMNAQAGSESHALSMRRLWLADLSLLMVAVIWGVNIPVVKLALLKIDPFAFNAIRLLVSSLVLIFCAWREFKAGVRPTADLSRRDVLIYASVVSVAYQLLFLLAVSRATSADVALIMATVPMWTAIGARLFLKEILPILAWTGLIVAFAGTMIVTLQKAPAVPKLESVTTHAANASIDGGTEINGSDEKEEIAAVKPPWRLAGNLLALSAALAWAGGTVFSRPLLGKISPIQLSACSATMGLPFHIFIALLIGWKDLPASASALNDVSLLACVVYSGTLSTGLALAMWSHGVKHAGAAHAAMIQNLTPIVAMAAAWVWLGETINSAQTLGGGMIIGGLLIMRRSRQTRSSRNG